MKKKQIRNDNSTEPGVEALTISQLCRRWQCTRNSILRAHATGRLALFKVADKNWRVTLEEVKRFESTNIAAGKKDQAA